MHNTVLSQVENVQFSYCCVECILMYRLVLNVGIFYNAINNFHRQIFFTFF